MSSPVDTFEEQRGRMFGIAYRMLGSATEAEDVVQDAWLRWQSADRSDVLEPGAYLATVVTRLSLTALDSARARREVYVGPWLPEPVSTTDDPLLGAERSEAMSLAVLLLLERLTPAERAAYVLHEAFGYPFGRIAEVLETSEANARKLGSRARAHLEREGGAQVSPAERDRLLAAFVAAAESGDLEALEAVLSEDVVTWSDGGGVVSAARRPVVGRSRVAAFLLGLGEKFAGERAPYPLEANGQPGIMLSRKDGFDAYMAFDVGPGGIRNILMVMNPSKLGRL
ncbi:MAG: RNA polymerase subunit sigma-24 [Micrococcales bacterium 70-64]|nr:MAG: RNA polymerase subunit sigma-24 [Leifsonia sp. SCN 70-46]OJX86617.1 MAG: RNA polymerase subunit sigma-24 [Micrococcales bacterium 70-64]